MAGGSSRRLDNIEGQVGDLLGDLREEAKRAHSCPERQNRLLRPLQVVTPQRTWNGLCPAVCSRGRWNRTNDLLGSPRSIRSPHGSPTVAISRRGHQTSLSLVDPAEQTHLRCQEGAEMVKPRGFLAVAGVAAATTLLAACGKSTTTTNTSAGGSTSAGSTTATVEAKNVPGVGMVLVDSKGLTLYYLKGETTSHITC